MPAWERLRALPPASPNRKNLSIWNAYGFLGGLKSIQSHCKGRGSALGGADSIQVRLDRIAVRVIVVVPVSGA